MNANIGILEANYYLPPTKKTLSQVFEDEEKSDGSVRRQCGL